jgi:tetraacyldisaccharide-1-P 4'-kinase
MEDVVQPRASQSRSDANTALPTPSTSATSTLKDAAVLCMSGIGSPASLVLLLRQLGATHVECCTFNDHHLFSKQVSVCMLPSVALVTPCNP